jgi:hypothetical protein
MTIALPLGAPPLSPVRTGLPVVEVTACPPRRECSARHWFAPAGAGEGVVLPFAKTSGRGDSDHSNQTHDVLIPTMPSPSEQAAPLSVIRILRAPLMLGVAMLLLGNGLIGTLLGVRAGIEAFPTVVIGIIMSACYLGYIAGARLGPAFIHRVGHIRTFAALAAIAATMAGLHAMFVAPPCVVRVPPDHRSLLRRPLRRHGELD